MRNREGGTDVSTPPCLHLGDLLALDAQPQHVLPVSHVRVLPNEVHVGGQQELPASVDARSCHLLQEIFDVLRRKLTEAGRKEGVLKNGVGRNDLASSLTLTMAATSFLIKERSKVNLHIWEGGGERHRGQVRAFSGSLEPTDEPLTTKSLPRQSTSAGTPL